VLFSDKNIAHYINSNFEPAWESVRPVPIVRIDFGAGKTLTRTLHGNIATYICSATGFITDVLPGIYQPSVYIDRLSKFVPSAARRTIAIPPAADLETLAEDTILNESVRRRQIQEKLASIGPTTPQALKHWLYKEVLHADLDDPYLGLGATLFSNYPF
jgi:hypothetical protein